MKKRFVAKRSTKTRIEIMLPMCFVVTRSKLQRSLRKQGLKQERLNRRNILPYTELQKGPGKQGLKQRIPG